MTNSRNKWHNFERQLAKEYRELGFEECVTARSESKRLDDRWIDLAFTDPIAVQSKSYTNFSTSQIIDSLKHMQSDELWDVCHVKIKNKGEIVAMSKSDWYDIVRTLRREWIIE